MTKLQLENIETGKLLQRFVSDPETGHYRPASPHLYSLVDLQLESDRKNRCTSVTLSLTRGLFEHPVLADVVTELVRDFLSDCLAPVPPELHSRRWIQDSKDGSLKLKGAQVTRTCDEEKSHFSIELSKSFLSGLWSR